MFTIFRSEAKMQWLQDPNQWNIDNLNNVNTKIADISGTK